MTAIEPPTLRPLTLSQLLDRAVRLYRQNFLVFVGIVAVMLVPLTLIQYASDVLNYPTVQRALAQMRNPSTLNSPLALLAAEGSAMGGLNTLGILALTVILLNCVAAGALSKAIEDSYLGRPVSILGSYRKIGGLLLPLLIAVVIALILIVVLWLWVIVPCVGWLTGPGLLMFFAYIIYPLVPVVVVIEGKRHFGAIGRAWELVRRRFWWVLGFVITLAFLGWIILIGPSALVTALGSSLTQGITPGADAQARFAIQSALSHTTTFLFNLVYLPLQLTAIVLMYFDLRVRTEGFDLAVLAASAEDGQTVAETTPQAPPSEGKPLVTLNEAGYFAAITLGVLLLCGILYGILIAFALMSYGASRGL